MQPHGLQPTRLLHPWDFPVKSTGVNHSLTYVNSMPTLILYFYPFRNFIWPGSSVHGILQTGTLESAAISFSRGAPDANANIGVPAPNCTCLKSASRIYSSSPNEMGNHAHLSPRGAEPCVISCLTLVSSLHFWPPISEHIKV